MALPLVAASACSSLDHDVIPVVVEARFQVDPALPDALSSAELIVSFDTDTGADRHLTLETLSLLEDVDSAQPQEYPLSFSFPTDFDGRVRHGEEPTLQMINVGTTNAMLSPLCGREFLTFVHVRYDDDSGLLAFNESAPAQLSCQ